MNDRTPNEPEITRRSTEASPKYRIKVPTFLTHLTTMLVVSVGLVSNANADIIHAEDITPYEDYRSYGETFTSSGWVQLSNSFDPNPDNVVWASGTKASENGFILAGHTGELWLNGTYDTMKVGYGTNYYTNPGDIYTITNVVLDPSYTGFGQAGRDVAFAFTDVAMNAPSALLYAGEIPSHADIWSAGYGMTGTVATGALPSNGDKLGTINRISVDNLTSRPEYFLTKFEAPESQYFREFGSHAFFGDSGKGGLLDSYLSAVASGTSTTVSYNQSSSWSRINYDVSTGILYDNRLSSVPEPSSLTLLGTVTGIIAARRRRRKVA